MEITVARNAEEILSLSAFRKSTRRGPGRPGQDPEQIPPHRGSDAIPTYAMIGNTPTGGEQGRRPYLVARSGEISGEAAMRP
jgi:hypothetical protein